MRKRFFVEQLAWKTLFLRKVLRSRRLLNGTLTEGVRMLVLKKTQFDYRN